MEVYVTALRDLVNNSGFSVLFSSTGTGNVVMLIVALILLYLAIGRGFEPLLLVPIAFGCLLVNGVANLGVRPSLDAHDINGGRVLLETHVFD